MKRWLLDGLQVLVLSAVLTAACYAPVFAGIWLYGVIGGLNLFVLFLAVAVVAIRIALSPHGFVERSADLWLAAVGMSLAALEMWKPLLTTVVCCEYFMFMAVLGYGAPVWLLGLPVAIWPVLPLLVLASTLLLGMFIMLEAEGDEFSDTSELARSFGH